MIGLDVDDLKLYIGDDYIINDSIKVLQPTIRQIAEFGERDFFSVVHTVTAIPSDMKSQLWDMGLDWTEVDDFELFVMLVQTLTLDRTELLFGNIDLSKLRPYKHPNIEDEIILVVPSDLLIENDEKFVQTVENAKQYAQEGKIVTFGVKPNYPETGFGYVCCEDGRVISFTEKPNKQTAQEFIEKGNYFWNSGIFMFKVSTIIQELEQYCPEISSIIRNISCADKTAPFTEFEKMPCISIDYALMEKSQNIAMVELQSDWKDLGSWKSIYEVSPKDNDGNVFVGHVLDKGSKNSFVYSSSKLVATIGLEDTVIVETEDAILACKKDKTQEVKQVYETLKEQHDGTQMVHKTVYRPWGFYTVIAEGEGFQTKLIHVNQGQKLSVQSHNHRSEHWVVLSGMAKVVLEGKDHILSPGHSIDIAVKAIHSLQNPYEGDLEIIEIQKGDILSEDDIIRYEDMYGRV